MTSTSEGEAPCARRSFSSPARGAAIDVGEVQSLVQNTPTASRTPCLSVEFASAVAGIVSEQDIPQLVTSTSGETGHYVPVPRCPAVTPPAPGPTKRASAAARSSFAATTSDSLVWTIAPNAASAASWSCCRVRRIAQYARVHDIAARGNAEHRWNAYTPNTGAESRRGSHT